MASLTTRQRDLIKLLLDNDKPIVMSEIASQLELTPRQVNYSLKGVRGWLKSHNIELQITPGVGVELIQINASIEDIKRELFSQSGFQLVLSVGQRQQLFALNLLTTTDPLILYNLQQIGQVSRTTILKDLEAVGEWVITFGLSLERRPNYGIWISGPERNFRQALAALLWGDTPFEDSLWQMSHGRGLSFSLAKDTHLLPILEQVQQLVDALDTKAMMQQVASAEANLGGRFADQSVLHLALMMAIQKYRIQEEQYLNLDHIAEEWIEAHPVWRVSQQLLQSLDISVDGAYEQAEVTMISMLLLACSKNDRYPGDLESDSRFPALIDNMMLTIGEAYELPELTHDATLRDGLIAYIVPACLRRRFRVWTPLSVQNNALSKEKYGFEYQLANHLVEEIQEAVGVTLPSSDVNNLAFLMRAAYIRERPHQLREIIVVCPSGMATAQLLVARLKARFPRIGNLTVVSMRELSNERLLNTDLIITTVPLNDLDTAVAIIQVHPQLLAEDIARITQWLA